MFYIVNNYCPKILIFGLVSYLVLSIESWLDREILPLRSNGNIYIKQIDTHIYACVMNKYMCVYNS